MAKFCTNCGGEISEGYAFCEKCGTPVDGGNKAQAAGPQGQPVNVVVNQQAQPQKKSNTIALVGFILSLFCGCFAPISLVLSIIGLVKAKDYDGDGKGFAIAGLIISILAILISLVYYFLVIVAAIAEGGY
jgi:hypothetical protein